MAKKFTLKAVRARDLANLLDSLSLKEIYEVRPEWMSKNNRFAANAAKELAEGNKELVELVDKAEAKIIEGTKEQVDSAKAEFKKVQASTMDEGEKKAKIHSMEIALNAIVNEKRVAVYGEAKIEEAGLKEVEIKIESDERSIWLREMFEKVAPTKSTGAGVNKFFVEILDALEGAKEA